MTPCNQGTRLPPIGFWSYARQDDDASEGRLSSLRALLRSELQTQYGREPIKVFQDVAAIPPGAEWNTEITNALDRSTFFIPIITPNFVESEWCIREVQIFLKREATLNAQHPELAGRRRIFPVAYVPIDNAEPFDPQTLAELKKLQWFDFTGLRFKDQHDEKVRMALSGLATGICRLINIRLETPLSEAEREQAARRRAAEEQARREQEEADRLARDTEAERRRNEAEAEAEKRRLALAEAARIAAEKAEADRLERLRQEQQKKRESGDRLRQLLAKLGLGPGGGGAKRLLVGAAIAVVVVGGAVLAWGSLGPNAEAKKALALITDSDWSMMSATDLTAKALAHTSLQKIETLAKSGDPKAETFVGLAYYAPATGVNLDFVEAGSWFNRAADKNDGRALYNLGDLYDFGHGVETDHAKATSWYSRSAELGNARGEYALGLNYQKGEGGLSRDDEKAASWVRKAADQGYSYAATDMGFLYDNGRGVPQSWTEGANWYRKAADLGDAQGQFDLGYDYANGQGVAVDKAQAAIWYQKAADQKYTSAQYNLGLMYAAGDGVGKDMAKARELISAAAASGHEKSKTWLTDNPAPTASTTPSSFLSSNALLPNASSNSTSP